MPIRRVGQSAQRLVTAMQQRDDSIDVLLEEFDKSIRLSRRVFQNEGCPETDNGMEPTTITSLVFYLSPCDADAAIPIETYHAAQRDDWAAIFRKVRPTSRYCSETILMSRAMPKCPPRAQASARDDHECAICLNSFECVRFARLVCLLLRT